MFALEASSVVSALTDSASTIATDALSVITSVLPIAIPVLAGGIVVMFGIKFIKRITAKA